MLIHTLIPKVMEEIGAIGKNRTNVQQNYQFRGIDDLYNAVHTALSKHGVFTVPLVEDVKREERQSLRGGTLLYTILTVKYVFFASDGSSIEVRVIGEGMDSGDKSCNKAMSAAQKYALLQVFCIPTEEPKDSETDSPEVAPATKPAPEKKEPPLPTTLTLSVDALVEKMSTASNAFELKARWEKYAKDYKALDPENQLKVRKAKDIRKTELTEQAKQGDVPKKEDIPDA